MPSWTPPLATSCRRSVAWLTNGRSWSERTLLAGLPAMALATWLLRQTLSPLLLTLTVSMLLLGVAWLCRRGWLRLFGPVLTCELVRLGRSSRLYIFRTAYAALLLLLLGWVYLIWLLDVGTDGAIPANQMAGLASTFFWMYLGVQFAAVVVLTPAYTAGAIAEEKERRTLEFLLATDLRDGEIVLGKLSSRLATLLLIAVSGLPVLSFLQLLGGVDPNLVLAGFAVTGLTMLSLAGLSLLSSVQARKARDAVALTFLTAAAYLVLSGLSWVLVVPELGVADFPSTDAWQSPVTVTDVVRTFSAGNIVSVLVQLEQAVGAGAGLETVLPRLVGDYAVFHVLVAGVCVLVATLRLRTLAVQQLVGAVSQQPVTVRLWSRPALGRWPMLWKEVHVEAGLRINWVGRLLLALLVITSLVPGLWIGGYYLGELVADGLDFDPGNFRLAMNLWVRTAGTLVACLLFLAVAVRAAGGLSGERDRQTLDGLLLSPLECREILLGKWVGSLASVRWALPWPGLIWLTGIVTGGLHPLALPLVVVCWLVHAAFLASLGLWFSLVSRTTLRATVWTLFSAVGLSVGHWFVTALLLYLPLSVAGPDGAEELAEFLAEVEMFALTPPLTMGWLTLSGFEFDESFFLRPHVAQRWTVLAVWGVVGWAVAAGSLWWLTLARFRVLANRVPGRRPVTTAGRAVPTSSPQAPAAVT